MRNFKELKIWQKGFEITVDTYKIVGTFPNSEKYSLSQQVTKSAVSIPSNIAEGSSRSSSNDYNRFLEISLGSSFELETQLLIAAVNFGDVQLINSTLSKIDEEQKMITSFIKKLTS
ncbi:MAG TPA: four helix bundle protein [Chitinophagaceae bacterium]|jgi:four helix bundle protein